MTASTQWLFNNADSQRKKSILQRLSLESPSTILKIHRALKKRKYHQIFGSKPNKPGPKGPSKELVKLVIQIKERNTRFGCTRIAMEVSRIFGIEINKDVVRRILIKHYRPKPDSGGPSWLTFLGRMTTTFLMIRLVLRNCALNAKTNLSDGDKRTGLLI